MAFQFIVKKNVAGPKNVMHLLSVKLSSDGET